MAMGERAGEEQGEFWIPVQEIVRTEGHPFYEKLNQVLKAQDFDGFVERRCEKFYKKGGRPSIPPGIYFRMMMVGFFEGLDSERGIAWRCSDSLALRRFLGYGLTEPTPEHSSLSVIRHRLDVQTHQRVFRWVLIVMAKAGLVKGRTVGIDATTLVANAAMRSIVRRDSGQTYEDFLKEMARNSGIAEPTREDIAKLDRKRKKKASNDDWTNPHDPDAKITKLKDGRTHLAHKDEHAVDMDTGAVLAVTVQGAHLGDTTSVEETISATLENLNVLRNNPETAEKVTDDPMAELVADKGYHSNEIVLETQGIGIRTYIAEPDRGPRKWEDKEEEQQAVYSNRRRIRGARGRRLMRKRGELLERPFAHSLETGGMRRVYLRGHENILKRLLIHVAGLNLGMYMRKLFGVGTPRSLQGLGNGLCAAFLALWRAMMHQTQNVLQKHPNFVDAALRFAETGYGRVA
jgi:transposase